MTIKLHSFTFLLLTTLLCGCIGETWSESYIKNDTNSDVVLVIKLDRNLTKYYGVTEGFHLISYANDTTCILSSIDSLNATATYILKGKSKVKVDEQVGRPEPKTIFEYLQIRTSKDTLTLKSNEEIKNAFNIHRPFYHELTIK